MATRDEYFIDLRVEQAKGLTEIQAMVKAMERLKRERKEVTAAYKQGLITEESYAKSLTRINVGLKGLSSRFREASNDAAGLTAQGLRFRDKMAGAMTGALRTLGAQMAGVFAVGQVINFFKTSIGKIEDFEKAVSVLGAISGATGEDLDRLTKKARELAAASQFTATQVIEAQTELAKLGRTAPEIEAVTEAVLLLATAGGSTVATAATYATTTMNQFGLGAAQAGRVVDVMAESFNRSALDIESWNNAFKQVGTTANAVDMSLEDTAAAISLLVDAGIPAEKAGTDLRNILIELAASGKTWEQAMDEINGSTDKLSVSTDLFGKRSGAAGIVLAQNTDKLQRLGDAYVNSAGAADVLAQAQLDNLKGDRLLLASAWEEFILSVEDGTGVVGTFARSLTQLATEVVTELAAMGDEAKETASEITRIERSLAQFREANKGYNTENSIYIAETEKRLLELRSKLDALNYRNNLSRVDVLQNELKSLERSGLALERQKELRIEINALIEEGEKAKAKESGAADPIEESKGIIGGLERELKLLRQRRDEITEEEGGRNEILRVNGLIEAKQQQINDLIGRATGKVKEMKTETEKVKEDLRDWTDIAAEFVAEMDKPIDREVEQKKTISERETGGSVSTGTSAAKQLQDEIDAIIIAGADLYIEQEKRKTEAKQAEEDARKEITKQAITQGIDIAASLGNQLIANEQSRAQRRLEVELDLLEKQRQNNEISQVEYERLTTEARKREFNEMKRLRSAEIIINGLAAAATELATKGQAGLLTGALVIGESLLMAGLVQAQQFAKGGKVQPLDNGKITGRPNIARQPNGDNVLATVKTGEVILNKSQQAALGGSRAFAKIGVPGFARGGGVDGLNGSWTLGEKKGINAPIVTTGLEPAPASIDYNRLAAAMAQTRIFTSVTEIQSALGTQNRVSELKTL